LNISCIKTANAYTNKLFCPSSGGLFPLFSRGWFILLFEGRLLLFESKLLLFEDELLFFWLLLLLLLSLSLSNDN